MYWLDRRTDDTGQGRLTSYFGRDAEGAEVRGLLGAGRLTTLTGPGGVGKTRLAITVMRQTAPDYAGGAVFVGLAELRDPALLANLIADRLGLHDRPGETTLDTVLAHLRNQALLLVLDNCEHVVGACADVVEAILHTCPGVVVLATGRQSLDVPGERVLPIPPLPVPPEAGSHAPRDFASVQLFLDRARAVVPSLQFDEDTLDDVALLCRRLDGLPLAIELAAARLRALSPRQIADRLDRGLPVLTTGPRTAPERQHTLRATIDWSYRLCSPAEQAIWQQVSVFAGSFELAAAEFVCAGTDTPNVLDLIDGLLDKSVLLREDHGDVVRYRLLETLREYGHELLTESGELTETMRRHCQWYDRLTARAEAEWVSSAQDGWVTRLNHEHANLRAALDWALRQPGEAVSALRIATRLDEYWTLRGSLAEARTWLGRALATTPADHPDRPMGLAVCALHALWQFDVENAETLLTETDTLLRATSTEPAQTFVKHVRALGAMLQRDFESAATWSAATAASFRIQGDLRREFHPLFILGVSTSVLGDLDRAREVVRRMLSLTRAAGEAYYLSMAEYACSCVEALYGDATISMEASRSGLRADLRIGNRFGAAHHTEILAWVAARQGDHLRSAILFGVSARLWYLVGSSAEAAGSLAVPHFDHLNKARAALGDVRFDQARAAGEVLPDDTAMAYALGKTIAPADLGLPGESLTIREREIASLVGAGLSNRDIAAELVISVRTVETHVQNIMAKFGVSNRTRIATWITSGDSHRIDVAEGLGR
ncbi:LuxR C-terminal-related transcriptional regulator [Amycolatopsis sp. QT-25]|uniref:ATP-binding protein n=1 Tax=Amycolatopsis sp. QT-25 TaxID=3034022 RepID=UPI0023EC2914|nr:LuxR C-terminal-related transcriptional regulator [Amycolatopsis sp. QT-25]WET76256.1 LuxR C-terminal-related transcriptional regulator [Amycolatopsis sp. QT-25]